MGESSSKNWVHHGTPMKLIPPIGNQYFFWGERLVFVGYRVYIYIYIPTQHSKTGSDVSAKMSFCMISRSAILTTKRSLQ